MVVTPISV